jgi:hypothetical protein
VASKLLKIISASIHGRWDYDKLLFYPISYYYTLIDTY